MIIINDNYIETVKKCQEIIPGVLFTLQFPVKSGRIEHRNMNHTWGKHG